MLSHRSIEVGGDHGPLADNVYCYIKIAGGVSVIQIIADPPPDPPRPVEEFIETKYPDFLSGAVLDGHIENHLLYSFKPTFGCTRMHGLATAWQPVQRLAVEPLPAFVGELAEPSGTTPKFSQMTKMKAGWFTGTMRKLVQFLMGYGKIPKETIYDPKVQHPPLEYFLPPETKFQRETKDRGLQIRYDWRFSRTHGLTRAGDGKWWIVEISQGRGVIAMPLKVYKQTTTDDFRDYLEGLGDTDALDVLDLFGGFPTGEAFPPTQPLLDSYIRAGLVLRLAPGTSLGDFYANTYYSTACGWAFSESGSRAVNTAYSVHEDNVQRGVMHEVTLTIGETEDTEPENAAVRLKQYLMKQIDELGAELLSVLIMKCDRLTDNQIAEFLGMPSGQAALALDELVLDPIAVGTASVAKVAEGKLWWPTQTGPALKFHEPLLPGLQSHDFKPAFPGPAEPYDYRCNTTVYAFFNGERLRKVNYYWLGEVGESGTESFGDQGCQYAGEWGYRTLSGETVVTPKFYTTEIDNREVLPSSFAEEINTGVDLGYTSVSYNDNLNAPWTCTVFRIKSFQISTQRSSIAFQERAACVAIPQNDREAYYYFERLTKIGQTQFFGIAYAHLTDPNMYTGGRYLITDGTPEGCGTQSTFRRINQHFYSGGGCATEYADEGQWASPCQQIEPMAYTTNIPNGFSEVNNPEDVSEISGKLVCGASDEPIEVYSRTVTGDGAVTADIFLFATTPQDGFTQTIRMNQNCFGESRAMMCSPVINEPMTLSFNGLDPDLLDKNATFIGVYQ